MNKLILICNGFQECNHPRCKHRFPHTPHPHHDLGSCYYMKKEFTCVPVETLYDILPELK